MIISTNICTGGGIDIDCNPIPDCGSDGSSNYDYEEKPLTKKTGPELIIGQQLDDQSIDYYHSITYSFTTIESGTYSVFILNELGGDIELNFLDCYRHSSEYGCFIENASASTSYNFEIVNYDYDENTVSYSVIVIHGNGSEGTPASPVLIPFNTDTEITMGADQNNSIKSYYAFTTENHMGSYVINLSLLNLSEEDFEWQIFGSQSFADESKIDFRRLTGTAVSKTFLTENLDANTQYYLLLQKTYYNDYNKTYNRFSININYTTGQGSEGTINSPVNVTSLLPYSGIVKSNGESFYSFTTSTDGSQTISLTNTTNEVGINWYLYSDSNFSNLLSSCVNYNIQCNNSVALTNGETYYIQVQGIESSVDIDNTLNITMDITP